MQEQFLFVFPGMWKLNNYKLQTTIDKLQIIRYKLQTTFTNHELQITNNKSSGIDHNVDELLVGLVTQIHLRKEARSKTCKVSTNKMMILRTSMRIKMFTMLSTSIINDLQGVNDHDDRMRMRMRMITIMSMGMFKDRRGAAGFFSSFL